MTPAVATSALGRRYGHTWALRDVDLLVEEGSIYGLLGANGAGKTSSLRILATLLTPSSGRVWIGGIDAVARPGPVRRRLGYMPDNFGVYDDLTVLEYLDFYATAHGVRRRGRGRLLDDLLVIVGLTERRASFVDVLSRGMKQRLGIARCLVHDPPLLLLDEPASGLDPLARREMQTLLRELAKLGKTILISSHILPELSELCTHVGIVDDGRLLLQGKVKDLLDEVAASSPVEVHLADPAAAPLALGVLRAQPGVDEVALEQPATLLALAAAGLEPVLFQALAAAGLPVLRFARRGATLEDVYFAVARGDGAGAA